MISYVICTRDRWERLAATLGALGRLGDHAAVGGAEVIVVDNASREAVAAPAKLTSGVPVRVIRLDRNEGAAARNAGARVCDARSEWLVMLDDDSHPRDAGVLTALRRAGEDVGAIAAEIWLPAQQRREWGGLPEVFVGCGVAIRRRAYLEAGGYDPSFGYYAEEYDLAARLLARGWRVVFDRWFRVDHHKVEQGRDLNRIVALLVRNNGWVVQRYAPAGQRYRAMRDVMRYYREVAAREGAVAGYACGVAALRATVRAQPRRPMEPRVYERFIGLSAAREALERAACMGRFATAALVEEGKHAWVVRQALRELGVREVRPEQTPDVLVIGTLSPGPMLDACDRHGVQPNGSGPRVIAPWTSAWLGGAEGARRGLVPTAAMARMAHPRRAKIPA